MGAPSNGNANSKEDKSFSCNKKLPQPASTIAFSGENTLGDCSRAPMEIPSDGQAVEEALNPLERETKGTDSAPVKPLEPPDATRETYTVPSYARWFSWNKIHEIERKALKDFFDGSSSSKTPKIYKEYRDFMINMYREDPHRGLTLTEMRKMLIGDVNSLHKIFNFLETWGLINFQVSSNSKLEQSSEDAPIVFDNVTPSGIFAGLPSNPVKRVHSSNIKSSEVDRTIRAIQGTTLASYKDVFNEVTDMEVSTVSQRASTGSETQSTLQRFCNNCRTECTTSHFDCNKAGFVLCTKCFQDGNYGLGLSAADFKYSNQHKITSQLGSDKWTDQETFLLLEGIMLHGDDWNSVVQHVGTKNEADCVMKLVQLPFGEHFMGNTGTEGNDRRSSNLKNENKVNDQAFSLKDSSAQNYQEDDNEEERHTTEEDIAAPPLKYRCLSPIEDASNPIMSQVAFLSTMVGPRVAAAAAEAAQESDVLVGSRLLVSAQQNASHANLPLGRAYEAASPSSVSKNFRADVLRENTEAVFAACDAAHGRWAKLLGVRALLHPKLRLPDFLSVYNITQDFLSATEKVGGRLGYSIRGTLQSQSKAFIDYQHNTRITKISAVLDQETWVAIDVPDEFQAIVDSLILTEAEVINEKQISIRSSNLENSNYFVQENINGQSSVADAQVSQAERMVKQGDVASLEMSVPGDQSRQLEALSQTVSTEREMVKNAVSLGGTSDDVGQAEISARGRKGREKSSVKILNVRGVGYHMVNCGIILLKMISEYMDISNALPAFASDVVHRAADILKLFNTRTCQLVLGAGAMQVSGLKSITAKHLALASQTISFFYALIPDIRRLLILHIPEAHKALLLSEIDRIRQDYKVHRDEIHSKLVQIMKERLMVHLRVLPQIAESWNKPEDNDTQPSQFARALTKEVGVLQRVLSPILLESDVQTIFRQVVQNFHSQISDAFAKIDVSSPQAKNRLYRDVQHILACIRSLPTDYLSEDGTPNPGQLDKFLLQRFGREAHQ